MRVLAWVLVGLPGVLPGVPVHLRPEPVPVAPEGAKAPDLPGLVKYLKSFFRKKELGKKEPDAIAKRLEGLSPEDLAWTLDRLREAEEKERGPAAAEVERLVEGAWLSALWSPGILRLPDAARRVAAAGDEAREALLADASRLEDPEPATRLALDALTVPGASVALRVRALETLADLTSWAGDPARTLPPLRKALEDPSPAVRDVALERLADLAEPSVLDAAMALAGAEGEEEAVVRGRKEVRRPGDRAIQILNRASRTPRAVEPETFRSLSAEDRAAVLEEFRAWRAAARGNPLRDQGEGPFDPVPKVVSALVDPKQDTAAALRWWSEVDRAQFRLDIDEFDVVAVSKWDFVASWRLTVIASGQRQGNWEAFARSVRCGMRYRLPRRGFGLVEASVQPLLDGRWKVFVRAYEWRGP
jgi:hypothetical protein